MMVHKTGKWNRHCVAAFQVWTGAQDCPPRGKSAGRPKFGRIEHESIIDPSFPQVPADVSCISYGCRLFAGVRMRAPHADLPHVQRIPPHEPQSCLDVPQPTQLPLKAISRLANCNYINARRLVLEAPTALFVNHAVDTLERKTALEDVGARSGDSRGYRGGRSPLLRSTQASPSAAPACTAT